MVSIYVNIEDYNIDNCFKYFQWCHITQCNPFAVKHKDYSSFKFRVTHTTWSFHQMSYDSVEIFHYRCRYWNVTGRFMTSRKFQNGDDKRCIYTTITCKNHAKYATCISRGLTNCRKLWCDMTLSKFCYIDVDVENSNIDVNAGKFQECHMRLHQFSLYRIRSSFHFLGISYHISQAPYPCAAVFISSSHFNGDRYPSQALSHPSLLMFRFFFAISLISSCLYPTLSNSSQSTCYQQII